MSSRLISIGMPIYNGGKSISRAVDCLLGQTHTHFELIISDNASTDGVTQSITEEYAQRDSRIRLTRQPVNLGAVPNFLWVLNEAKGEYFMWAADDDFWSANYLEELAARLDEVPEAILATPQTQVAITYRNGVQEQQLVPQSPDGDRDAIINAYIQNFKSYTWIYGLYRTQWLQKHALEWSQYPLLGGDIIWMWGVILRERIVGNFQATFFYTANENTRKIQTYRQRNENWDRIFYHICRLSWSRLPPQDRFRGIVNACCYYYRNHLYRKNRLFTWTIRIPRMALLWCWIRFEQGARAVNNRLYLTLSRQGNRTEIHIPSVGPPCHTAWREKGRSDMAETPIPSLETQHHRDSPPEQRDAT